MRVVSKKQKKYGGGGRMYANGGGIPGAPSGMDMYNALSPSLKQYADDKAMREYYAPYKETFYKYMSMNNFLDPMRDRDGNVVPGMYGEDMRSLMAPVRELSGREQGQAEMGMFLNRLLQMAMAGDSEANQVLNNIQTRYDSRQAAAKSEAERMARLSKGSGKPGPYER